MNLFKKTDKYSKITPAPNHNRIKGVKKGNREYSMVV